MAAKVTFRGKLDIPKMAKSGELLAALEPIANEVLAGAREDPNEEYVKSLRKKPFVTGGRLGRVSWQVGAAPIIGTRVEAKRGTLARAVGRAGA